MNYQFYKNIMQSDAQRTTFNALAQQTFHLSFEEWYQSGYWAETNMPYTLFDGPKAIANVSVNRMEVLWEGQTYTYLQLGTVMTDPDYRGLGLSRFLMGEILKDWEHRCDCILLFANGTVLDFYPKFGFQPQQQYRHSFPLSQATGNARKLQLSRPEDQALLQSHYNKGNPFSRLQVVKHFSLLMFYCLSPMRNSIYFLPELDAVVVAQQQGESLHCFEIFCDAGRDLQEILRQVAAEGTQRVVLEFTPLDGIGHLIQPVNSKEDTLFLYKGKANIFAGQKLLFPTLSHT